MKLTEAINTLKKGIQEGDEELIEEGFYLLTGERVIFPDEDPTMFTGGEYPHKLPPAFKDVPPVNYFQEPKAEIMPDILRCGKKDVEMSRAEDFTMNKDKQPAKRREFVNNFNPELQPDKEQGAELINDDVAPTPRTRAAHQMTSVMCQDCHKNIELNPALISHKKGEPYHCDLLKCGQPCPNIK